MIFPVAPFAAPEIRVRVRSSIEMMRKWHILRFCNNPAEVCFPRWGDQKADFTGVGSLKRGDTGSCLAQAVSNTYLNVANSESDPDRVRIGFQYEGTRQGLAM